MSPFRIGGLYKFLGNINYPTIGSLPYGTIVEITSVQPARFLCSHLTFRNHPSYRDDGHWSLSEESFSFLGMAVLRLPIKRFPL